MKAQVLFDGTGRVISMMHMSAEQSDVTRPAVTFKPQQGQQVATFDIPADLRDLSPGRLQAALHVDLGKGSPRLVAKGKR